MVMYTNERRIIVRSKPDPWLEASKRWERVKPLSRIPAPERAPEHDDSGGTEPSEERSNDGGN